MLSRILVASAFSVTSLPRSSCYPALGPYMPVSNVLEHAQMTEDVRAFNEALTGDNPDYSKAKRIYSSGTGASCKSPVKVRTLQGFAQADLAGESYYDTFIAAGSPPKWWDSWMLMMLDDTAGLSRVKRVTCLKKGALGLMTFYTSHELEAAIVKAQDPSTRSDTGSAFAWDEAWAFFYGNDKAGADSAWEAARKRDGDFPNGANISGLIATQFNKGLVAVRSDTYDLLAAEAARDDIYRMWVVSYLRAALKYLELAESSYDEKAHAEGYAYFLPIIGLVHAKSPEASKKLEDALDITKMSIGAGTYCAAKAAAEAAYPALGLSCGSVGDFKDAVITTCPCSGSTGMLSAGVGPVTAVNGTGTDVTCTPPETTAAPPETTAMPQETPSASGVQGSPVLASTVLVVAAAAARA